MQGSEQATVPADEYQAKLRAVDAAAERIRRLEGEVRDLAQLVLTVDGDTHARELTCFDEVAAVASRIRRAGR